MFGKGLQLFKLFGFSVKADWSGLIVVVLMVWSLALRIFPGDYPNLPLAAYLVMAILGTLGLFLSIGRGASRLMVVDHGKLRGTLSLQDILRFLSLRLEMDSQASA